MSYYYQFEINTEDADLIYIIQDSSEDTVGGTIKLHIDQVELLCKALAETKKYLIESSKDYTPYLPTRDSERFNG